MMFYFKRCDVGRMLLSHHTKESSKTKGKAATSLFYIYFCLFPGPCLPLLPVFGQSNPVSQTPVVAEEQEYAFAVGLYHDGVYQLAEEQFGKFLNHYPASIKRIDAFFLQNECRYYQGNYDSAIQGLTES